MRFALCFVCLFLPSLSVAQNHLGARLGLNAATVAGDFVTSDAASTRLGFAGGFYLRFPLRYSLALQAEILYAQKGFTTDEVFDASGMPLDVESATFELTTLDVPLLVAFAVPVSRDASLSLYAGPYLSFELAERLRVEMASGPVPEESDRFKGTDLGFALGFDVTVAFRSIQPTFGIRYARSVSNQLEENASSDPEATAYSSVLSFLVGIRL